MKRVLFVDDEVAVLDGLRDRLRKHRREWEMVFALGGEAALAECQKAPFHVVVSDMRMPKMDGATLLHRIRESYPGSVRIVLSGHAERQAVLRALPVAHQYLSKPCDADTLRGVIARACTLQEMMGSDALRSLVGRVERLPSVSEIYSELTQVLAREAPSIDDVVQVVERDPAMCLKILQVVNSAFFGLPRRVSAMREAISYLGIEPLKALVVATQIFSAAEGQRGLSAEFLARVQQHSALVARLARAVAPTHAEDAFMAGMLHDVGHILLALADPESRTSVPETAKARAVPAYVVERERLGVTHADVGAYVLGTWGVPFPVVEAVAGHHEPARMGSSSLDAITAVHVAEALVREGEGEAGSPGGTSLLDTAHLDRLGLRKQVEPWREIALRLRDQRQG
ncbi:MAG: HDOD domain-containing protein [Myxococcales bacterium]|nr:HDOD domain-containing protein [Myxococcales bacterium]